MNVQARLYKQGQDWHVDIKHGWFWYRFYSGTIGRCRRIVELLKCNNQCVIEQTNGKGLSPLSASFCLQLAGDWWIACKVSNGLFGTSYVPMFKIKSPADKDRLIKYFLKSGDRLPINY